MKTVLEIDDTLGQELQKVADQTGQTPSMLVERAVKTFLKARNRAAKPKRLPTFKGGKCQVDISDHDELCRVMGDRSCS